MRGCLWQTWFEAMEDLIRALHLGMIPTFEQTTLSDIVAIQ